MRDAVICEPLRTPVGGFGGSLRDVPLAKLAEPWTMSGDEKREAGCVIGSDYPAPVVDHKAEREHAMARYRAVARN